jgi:N-methylhydantoinase A
MSNAVRTVTIERGHDPRTFAMVAYGGALGIFAADIARTAGISTVVIPADAAVFSAYGLLNSDDVRTQARSATWAGGDATHVAAGLRELDAQLVGALKNAGHSDEKIEVEWEGEFKYLGQQWELPVRIPRKDDLAEADLAAAQVQFPALYEAEYGSGTAWTGAPIVLMSVRVTATGTVAALEPNPAEIPDTPPTVTPTGSRRVFLPLIGEDTELTVYDAGTTPAGSRISGPAVLEHPLTTIQVPPGWTLRVDRWSNYVLTGDQPNSARNTASHKGA